MEFELIPFASNLIQRQAINEIIACNDITENYGLVLTTAQAVELIAARTLALRANGRIEFGQSVIDKIITEFCDSPYIFTHNYTQTLHELIDMFYYFKNETLDLMGDGDLIKYMKKAFDGVCQGSLDLLAGRELTNMARNLRFGFDADYAEDIVYQEDAQDEEH